jgi:ribulose-5-phosphate 4-epimerase/fuculose-1-phosphate aldolase
LIAIVRIHLFDTQELWPAAVIWSFLDMKRWSGDSQSLQRLAQALGRGGCCLEGAMQREEQQAVAAAEIEVSNEAVVAAEHGISGCGEGGRQGCREHVFTARTVRHAEGTHT